MNFRVGERVALGGKQPPIVEGDDFPGGNGAVNARSPIWRPVGFAEIVTLAVAAGTVAARCRIGPSAELQ